MILHKFYVQCMCTLCMENLPHENEINGKTWFPIDLFLVIMFMFSERIIIIIIVLRLI